MVFKVGLTGGIGSGKSTVCQLFSGLDVPIIDADLIAHQLSRQNQSVLHAIVNAFGEEFLTTERTLDRKKLRRRIFSNIESRSTLENILHPLIYEKISEETAKLEACYCIICLPLLVETGAVDTVDRVLVVDTTESLQLARALKRDQSNKDEILAIMEAQAPRQKRLSIADDLIDNKGNPEQLCQRIMELHRLYRSICSKPRRKDSRTKPSQN